MAEVWAADDLELDRPLAIKFLAAGADAARFEREARATAALAHPNLIKVYDYGEVADRPYLVLEYLSGGRLEDKLASRAPLEDAETAKIAGEVAAGLAHAHARGVTHRDLKPANILFDGEGLAKITDFGVAQFEAAGALTETGTLLGTAAYISPEQAAGAPATAASDVYSFGVILYRMLSGELPFEARNPFELARQHREVVPPPLTQLRPSAPAELAWIAQAALAKDPRERPNNGEALAAMLQGAAVPAASPDGSSAPTQVLTPRRTGRRRRMLLVVAVVTALLAGGFVLALLVSGSHSSGSSRLKTSTPSASSTGHRATDNIGQVPGAGTRSSPPTEESTTTRAETRPSTAPGSTGAATTGPPPATTEPTTTGPETTAATTTETGTETTVSPTATTGPPATTSTGP
jgi:eukaryotic-like serine/threonine-protein kinase